jgi:methylated-DNA-protein-cysteine methyltransferase-like protein
MNETSGKGLYERIYDAVLQVPPGYIATYGDIAAMVGGCDARTVGYALNELPKWREQEVPWQRIINSQGGISTRGVQQRERLEAEGIVFDARGRVSLARFRWRGAAPDEDDDAGQLSLF